MSREMILGGAKTVLCEMVVYTVLHFSGAVVSIRKERLQDRILWGQQ